MFVAALGRGGGYASTAVGTHRRQSCVKSPDLPPDLWVRRTASMRMPRSTDLHMSYTVSAATEAAVSASISTPVCPVVLTVAAISTALSVTSNSSDTALIGNGWHSGMSSAVRLDAMMPAMR